MALVCLQSLNQTLRFPAEAEGLGKDLPIDNVLDTTAFSMLSRWPMVMKSQHLPRDTLCVLLLKSSEGNFHFTY